MDDIRIKNEADRRERLRSPKKSAGERLNLPFEISLKSISEIDKFERKQDKASVKQFNDDVAAWSIHVTRRLKANVRARVKRDHVLSESIRPNLYYDRQYGKEVNRIGFSFAREGVYIHKGAGKGYGGLKGSQWYSLKGELKSTNEKSFNKMGTGNRQPNEWFDPIIEQELSKLADIVSEYSATLQIDATTIYID